MTPPPDIGPGSPDRTGLAIRGGAIRVIGYGAGVLVSLASAAILVRHLGISEFGRYVTVISLIGLVGGVTEAGIYVYGIREFGARTDRDRRELMAHLLTTRLLLTLAGIACAVCFGLAVGYAEVLVLGTLVAGAGLLVQVTADVLSIPLQAELRLGRLALVDLIRRLLALAMIGALALVTASLLPFFAAATAAGAIALAMLARIVRSSITIRLSFERRAWRELLREMLPYAIVMSIGAVYFYVTVIIMSLVASATQTGLFGTSFRVTQVALAVPALLLTAIFPLMSREHTEESPTSGHTVGKVFTVSVICGTWMSLAMALGAPFIIRVIAGEAGRDAVPVLQIQALVFIASFISTSSALALLSLRRYRPLTIAGGSVLALNIALALGLVAAFGAEGGALGDVISEAVVAVWLTAALMRTVPGHGIRPSVIVPVVPAAGLAASVLLLPIGSVARVIAATIIYFGVLSALGAIPPEVRTAARRLRALRAPTWTERY